MPKPKFIKGRLYTSGSARTKYIVISSLAVDHPSFPFPRDKNCWALIYIIDEPFIINPSDPYTRKIEGRVIFSELDGYLARYKEKHKCIRGLLCVILDDDLMEKTEIVRK